MSSAQQVAGAQTRDPRRWDTLLDAALAVFHEKGYERASMADVADAAGLAKPTLYHYTRSKQALLEAILLRSHERLTGRLAELPPRDSALDMVWQTVHTHVLFNIEYRNETTVFLADFRTLDESRQRAINEMLSEYDRRLQALVEEAKRRGETSPDVDARLAVLFMLGAANFVSRWYRARPDADPERVAEAFADLAIGSLLGPDRGSS